MAPRPRKTGSKDLPPNLYRKTDSRNGVTYYSYRDPVTGKWHGLGTDKARAVREAAHANITGARMQPTLVERIAAAPTRRFSEWIDEYRKLYAERDVSDQSKETVRMRLNRLSEALGHHDTAALGTFEVAGYLKTFTDEGKAQMAKAMRSLLSDLMREAIAAGWRKDNPVEVTRAAKVKVKRERLTLEKEGKAVRERGKIGHPHLWWRIERKPLGDREVVLCMGLAAAIHKHAGTLRSVLARLSTRAADPKLRYVLGLAQTSSNPHAVVAGTLQLS